MLQFKHERQDTRYETQTTKRSLSGRPHAFNLPDKKLKRKSYMCQTQNSLLKVQNSLNLREKIFELHDAVKNLQKDQQPKVNTESLEQRLTGLENQLNNIQKAILTLADAVTEEFDQIRKINPHQFDELFARV